MLFIHLSFCFVVRFKSTGHKTKGCLRWCPTQWDVPLMRERSGECPFQVSLSLFTLLAYSNIFRACVFLPSHTHAHFQPPFGIILFAYAELCSSWQLYDAGVSQYLHVRLCYYWVSGEICCYTVIMPRGAVARSAVHFHSVRLHFQ